MMHRFFWLPGLFILISSLTLQAEDAPSRLMEREAYEGVNHYRESHDLAPLAWDESVAAIARGHSRDMALHRVPFGHEGFMNRVHQTKDALAGTMAYAENVFMANYPGDISDLAVKSWLKSPEHFKNIVGNYNITGMGVWQTGDGYVYFTQFFVRQKVASETGASTPTPLLPGVAGMGLGGSLYSR